MLKLRPYKPCDAQVILSWCKDEVTFRRWTSDRYDTYPITPEDMNKKYIDCNGDCSEPDNFFPMTAFDENGLAGHMIMRFTDEEKSVLRFGFVILNDAMRGKGYGKEMIRLALQYAFEILRVEKVTIGVFENNPAAYHCYRAAGFREVEMNEPVLCQVCGETWSILELELEKKDYERGIG